MDPVIVLVCALAALACYFLPTIIASSRSHRNSTAIFLLNLFLGWTFLGWLGALIWAVTYQEPRAA
jgi:hypothetical protein